MLRRTVALALTAALGASAAAAAPAPAAPNTDLRCIIIANALGAQTKDQRQMEESRMMLIFFLGKVEARTPNLSLAPALQAQDALIRATPPAPAEAQAQVKACVSNFESRMGALTALMKPPAGATPASPPAAPAAPAPK